MQRLVSYSVTHFILKCQWIIRLKWLIVLLVKIFNAFVKILYTLKLLIYIKQRPDILHLLPRYWLVYCSCFAYLSCIQVLIIIGMCSALFRVHNEVMT